MFAGWGEMATGSSNARPWPAALVAALAERGGWTAGQAWGVFEGAWPAVVEVWMVLVELGGRRW